MPSRWKIRYTGKTQNQQKLRMNPIVYDLIVAFHYLKGIHKKVGKGLFIGACNNRTKGNGFRLSVEVILGKNCSEKMWMPHSWKCLTGFGASWDSERCPCPQQQVGTRSLSSLPTHTIPWFYVSFILNTLLLPSLRVTVSSAAEEMLSKEINSLTKIKL